MGDPSYVPLLWPLRWCTDLSPFTRPPQFSISQRCQSPSIVVVIPKHVGKIPEPRFTGGSVWHPSQQWAQLLLCTFIFRWKCFLYIRSRSTSGTSKHFGFYKALVHDPLETSESVKRLHGALEDTQKAPWRWASGPEVQAVKGAEEGRTEPSMGAERGEHSSSCPSDALPTQHPPYPRCLHLSLVLPPAPSPTSQRPTKILWSHHVFLLPAQLPPLHGLSIFPPIVSQKQSLTFEA